MSLFRNLLSQILRNYWQIIKNYLIKMKNCIILEPNPKNSTFTCKDMTMLLFTHFAALVFVSLFDSQSLAHDQAAEANKINFGYSKNRDTKTKKQTAEISDNSQTQKNSPAEVNKEISQPEENTIAKKTLEIAKKSSNRNLPPTEIYKVGVGDILFISLQNAPAKDST